MLLTPSGYQATTIDRIMLLSRWAKKLHNETQDSCLEKPLPVLMAGMGRPSYPLNKNVAKAAIQYWNQVLSDSTAVIDYGDPRGDIEARQKIAIAFSNWYQIQITSRNILFAVGGAGAIQVIFQTLSENYNNGLILTPFPYYSLYKKAYKESLLYPIYVMQAKGYQLTSTLLENALQKSHKDALQRKKKVTAILLCDPNNPLGTIIEDDELYHIADVLRKYPDILIILDEAYAEMRLDGKQHMSLLRIAPDLSRRIVLMRSATKALSAAGERMAVLIAFNDTLMDDFLQRSVNLYGHAPRSLQHIYAEAMEKLDFHELKSMNYYYYEHIRYAEKRLSDMNITMPDKEYRVEGTFYIVANFSELIGHAMPENAKRALPEKNIVETDEDIAYYLLFKYSVMIAPLSYFGLPDTQGYMRITCSGGKEELKNLLDRLETAIMDARIISKLIFEQLEVL